MIKKRSDTDLKIIPVILAYNHVEDTLECLRSLSGVSTLAYETILVDNGSTDGTADIVHKQFPEITVLRLDPNAGIARGYNFGLEHALTRDPDYVAVINNDTVFDPLFIDYMLGTFEQYADAGMVMPKIYHYYGEPGRLWSAGARWRAFPPSIKMLGAGTKDGLLYSDEYEIEYAPSCCLLIETESLREVGLFDPNYYFYFDDWDLCERFRAAGKKIYFSPQAKIWHKVALSTLKSDPSAIWWKVMGKSSVRFFLKHKSVLTFTLHTGWIILREAFKFKLTHIPAYVSGIIAGLRKARSSGDLISN
jgi:GT2 family glycosyltransferase